MSETNWMLQTIQNDEEFRSTPNAPTTMQRREHRIVTRYKFSDQAWAEAVGSTSATVSYFVGSEEREAAGVSGKIFRCTSDQADEDAHGVEWRKITQRWESWGAWVAFTPP